MLLAFLFSVNLVISLLLCSPSSLGEAALFPFFSWGGTKWDPEQPRERKSLDFAFFLQLLLLVKSFWPVSDGSRVEAEDGDAAGSRTRGGWERGCRGSPHQDKLLQLPSGQQSSVTLLLINNWEMPF